MRVLLFALALFVSTSAQAQDAIRVTTPRGAVVEVIAEKPVGNGPFPAVILGSGSGYNMRQPILERLAHDLVAQGIAVYRLDWAYRVAGTPFATQPRDKKAEIEDMRTVLELARHDRQIDPARIALAGKSLGSVIAWQLLRQEPEVKGAIMLTPVCDPKENPDAPARFYPDLGAETRPRLWIMGDVDPVCPVPLFHRYLADGGAADRLAVIAGNHSYQSPDHPGRDKRSLDLAAQLTVDFALTLLVPASDGR
jgi:dienelactone hydrolase